MMNEYVAWELMKEKRAALEREAEDARLAATVAGPDPAVRVVRLAVLAVAAVLLWMMI